jgi:hypothetical protein
VSLDVARYEQELAGSPALVNAILSATPRQSSRATWPEPPAPKALRGLAGDFVRAVEPHTEADPVALLTQFLLGYGNLIGRRPYYQVEEDRHYTNESAVFVGASAKARKGTSESRVRAVLAQIDPDWAREHVNSGLSSGEGLIWAVRDAIAKREPIRERGRIRGYETVEHDPGVSDKRLQVFEPEFASVLRQLERDGNILSMVLRQAWDSGNLRTMAKNAAAVATGAHISVVGHITDEELRRYLSATEQANGFANRYIWLCVKRSKFLPEGSDRAACERALSPVIEKLKAAVGFARGVREMRRDLDARDYWRGIYRDLSSGKPGLLGAITSRAEAHVTRLSCIYALLDSSAVVRGEHLEAALALWEFSERSCLYVFGDATGNPDADCILKQLRACGAGMSRTDISNMFARSKPASAISKALDSLLALGMVKFERQQTGGRPVEMWFAL